MDIKIVELKVSNIRMNCSVHGVTRVKPAYDCFTKAMTGMSCAECPTITKGA